MEATPIVRAATPPTGAASKLRAAEETPARATRYTAVSTRLRLG
jgi:hypothetical protein